MAWPQRRSARIIEKNQTNALGTDTPSRLLKLPAELRNRIYYLVVPQGEEIQLLRPDQLPSPSPPITRVCRQLRNETLSIYHSENTWIIGSTADDVDLILRRWLARDEPSNIEDRNLRIDASLECMTCDSPDFFDRHTHNGRMRYVPRRSTCEHRLTVVLEKHAYSVTIHWLDDLDPCPHEDIENAAAYLRAKGWMQLIGNVTGKELKETAAGLIVYRASDDS